MTAAQKIIANNKTSKSNDAQEKSTSWWKDQLKAWSKDAITVDAQLSSVEQFKRGAKTSFAPMAVEVRLFQLHLILKRWASLDADEGLAVRDSTVTTILRILGEIRGYEIPISPDVHRFLTNLCTIIGFGGYATNLLPTSVDESLPSPSFSLPKLISSKKGEPIYGSFMKITSSPIEWQLEHYGEWMDRSMDSAQDDRVSFAPDKWQRDVLNAVDREESVLALGSFPL